MKSIKEYIQLVEAEQTGYNPADPSGWEWIKQKAGQGMDDLERWARSGRRDASIAKAQGQDVMPSDPTNPAYKRAYPQQAPAADQTQYAASGVSKTGWDVKPQATAQATPGTAPAPGTAATQTPATPQAKGPMNWKQIYDANKDVIGPNPNLIKPGQKLKMPDGTEYVVKPGDTLSKIAGGSAAPSASAKATPKASATASADTLAQQTGVTAQASQNPATGQMMYTNAPQGQTLPQPNVAKGAVNQDVLNKAAELIQKGDFKNAKTYMDLAARQQQAVPKSNKPDFSKALSAAANPYAAQVGATVKESSELSDILKLANLDKK